MRSRTSVPCALIMLLVFGISAAADTVKLLPVSAYSMLWDRNSRKIYATVPASNPGSGTRANTLTVINPETAEIVSSVFVGAEPGNIAMSSSGRYLYIAVGGANSVRVYDVVRQSVGPMIPLGAGISVAGMCAVPGYPDSIAVQRQNRSYSPSDNGTVILNSDGSTRKKSVNSGHSLVYDAISNRMYGFENEISSYGLRTMSAGADGVVELDYREGLLTGNVSLVAAQNGLLYSNTGAVLDPIGAQSVGQFPGFGYDSILTPDTDVQQVFFANHDRRGLLIEAYDMNTFVRLDATVVPGMDITRELIRWGTNGFAFTNSKGMLCLLQSDIVGKAHQPCDLAVVASGLPPSIANGASAKCTVKIRNRGMSAATGVVLMDQLSRNADILRVYASTGSPTAAMPPILELLNPSPQIPVILSHSRSYQPENSQLLQEVGLPALRPGGACAIKLKARLAKGNDAIGLFVIAVVHASNTPVDGSKQNFVIASEAIP